MSQYITLPVETDPDALQTAAFDYIKSQVPGWSENAGNLETFIVQAVARMVAELRDVAADVPPAIFRYFGASVANIPPVDATAATVTSTWTLTDTLGHLIPGGTAVGIPDSSGNLQTFQTLADVVVAAGSGATGAGAVTLVATTPGAAASGLNGTPQLLDPLAFVTSIALVGSTAGGVDAEDDDAYLARLSTTLQLMAPRPILARDFAVFARQITGVYRALAIDGYNPADLTYNNLRTVAVACVDSTGAAVSGGVKTAVAADLAARREVNFIVNVIDPTYSIIDVALTGKAYSGFDLPTVNANVLAAIQTFLSPANWGQPRYGDVRDWVQVSTLRYLELAEAINRVEGFDYIQTLTFGVHGGAQGTSDLVLTGAAPMPTYVGGTQTVTVT